MKESTDHISARIVLLNQKNEVLLMKVEDPSTTKPGESYNGTFCFLIGGQIEQGESLNEAAYRELKEETGLEKSQVELGPEIWFGDFHLILAGEKRHMKQRFILAKTACDKISLSGLTSNEKKVVQSVEWYSLERMKNAKEIIYPAGLEEYLLPITKGIIPETPTEIILDRKPK